MGYSKSATSLRFIRTACLAKHDITRGYERTEPVEFVKMVLGFPKGLKLEQQLCIGYYASPLVCLRRCVNCQLELRILFERPLLAGRQFVLRWVYLPCRTR